MTESEQAEPARDDPGRHETEAERNDRALVELLQELRIAGLGVQVLFGFLLAIPFSARYRVLDGHQHELYLASLYLSAGATVLLAGPVAFHRLVFHRHVKGHLMRAANNMALCGLAAVALAVTTAVALVTSVVAGRTPAAVVGVVAGMSFFGLWFAYPTVVRRSAPVDASGDERR